MWPPTQQSSSSHYSHVLCTVSVPLVCPPRIPRAVAGVETSAQRETTVHQRPGPTTPVNLTFHGLHLTMVQLKVELFSL
ncbi:hypothetical protein DPMN_121427 [Dreissena polymorpha]|uniref:Uncharacterized protein n=1 Tax=Dreissena polymorpha TaxID=45954 RepID=A0A9D4GM24_DREPO|nr:hypothetical protein DPMN_121427 [Dreissena polymorpha]